MTFQQYLIVVTHKHLDRLEEKGTPHTRVSKELDDLWLKQIKEAQERFKKKQTEEIKESDKSVEDTVYNEGKDIHEDAEDFIKKSQENMMKNIKWSQDN